MEHFRKQHTRDDDAPKFHYVMPFFAGTHTYFITSFIGFKSFPVYILTFLLGNVSETCVDFIPMKHTSPKKQKKRIKKVVKAIFDYT